jgi:hypothetical protein
MKMDWLKEFQSPGSAYRGKPFWAWNGKLEPQELRRQIRILRRMGLGGFFMHSRVGLATPYLKDEWFRCVDACVDEARKLGMEAWLYDEDRWPSGAAGGLVTKNHAYRMRHLKVKTFRRVSKKMWSPDLVAIYAARVDGTSVTEYRRIKSAREAAELADGEILLAFYLEIDRPRDWYNGQTYLDTLNPAAVREFIRVTHEAYRRRYAADFGGVVAGMFTDEPNHGAMIHEWGHPGYVLPWTDRLPAVFRKRYGYDLLDHLPEVLFDPADGAISQPRYHYHDCVTFLFVDSFSRQIGSWCGKNNLPFTGHVLGEETLASQSRVVGSAMRFYEYMQAPGMDLLTETNREYDTAKQVASMARQFGRKWRLTETYGCTGWDFPFEGHKALGDWQVALGINLRCQHLSWYTMQGEAKRDYPAGIFYQSPWWELYPKVEDYYARIHAVMTRGKEVRDVLVIHPVESMWTLMNRELGGGDERQVKALNNMISDLRDALLVEHLDFDYGDEEVMSRHARVVRSGGVSVVKVGEAAYRAVVVPPLKTIRKSTVDLLRRFRRAGGLVVFAGEAPGYVDALPSESARYLSAQCARAPVKGGKLAAEVSVMRRVSIADEKGREVAPALYLLREDADAYYLFVCNTSIARKDMTPGHGSSIKVRARREAFAQVRISGFQDCKGKPLELDAETGTVYGATARYLRKGWEIITDLPRLGSRTFVIPKKAQRTVPPLRVRYAVVRARRIDSKAWSVGLTDDNVMVLDRPEYRIDRGGWHTAEEVLRVDKIVRAAMGLHPRGGDMKQPWTRKSVGNPKHVCVDLKYNFDVKTVPAGPLFIAMERPECARVFVNGAAVSMDAECGWWTDRSLRKLPVAPSLMKAGRNEIVVAYDYDETFSGLEIVYLLGRFGAHVDGVQIALVPPPTVLKCGDWCAQGLPFYAGSVIYSQRLGKMTHRKNERVFLAVPKFAGVAVRVAVNGQSAGVIAWDPYEVDITDLLSGKAGDEVQVEVIGHRRNSHGPLHHAEKWPRWSGPGEFQEQGKLWKCDYNLVPCGLMQPLQVLVKRRAPRG